MPLEKVTLSHLTIDDDSTLSKIALYRSLKKHVIQRDYAFRVPTMGTEVSWDRALFLNLTFWSPRDGADVLCERRIAADVAHVGWHDVVNERLGTASPDQQPGVAALFFGESIASAFDLYLLGRLLEASPECDFVESQVPIMTEAAEQAGLCEDAFEALLHTVCAEPERAFEDMRALLYDTSLALYACASVESALDVFDHRASHRFAPLLHHYQLSNWVLYARAHAGAATATDDEVMRLDDTLRAAPCSLDWLGANWLPSAD